MITFLLFIIAVPILIRIAMLALGLAGSFFSAIEDHPWLGLVPAIVIWGGAALCKIFGWMHS